MVLNINRFSKIVTPLVAGDSSLQELRLHTFWLHTVIRSVCKYIDHCSFNNTFLKGQQTSEV